MKKIPKLKSEAREREFWAKADSTRYVNWKRGRRVVFPSLKPSLKTIHQSLLKIFLAERVEQELREHRRKLARA